MAKKTLEAELKERRNDPRALRAALRLGTGKGAVEIIFGAVGDLPRVALKVSGNKVTVIDNPASPEAASEEKPENEGKGDGGSE